MMNQKNEMEYIPSSRQKMVPNGKNQEETEHTKSLHPNAYKSIHTSEGDWNLDLGNLLDDRMQRKDQKLIMPPLSWFLGFV